RKTGCGTGNRGCCSTGAEEIAWSLNSSSFNKIANAVETMVNANQNQGQISAVSCRRGRA
ncbi:MAG: hypothetical protein KIC49_23595, partial [Pseudomonas fluorescens]|nr:hypothetical protein [Pseudomonas fluorescens]